MSGIRLSASDKTRFQTIQKELIEWDKKNRRQFSWRKNIRDPYEVLVCEVMGQQTQASRIEECLPRFLKKFPTIKALASARQSEVIRQWQGLGYNRRALNLHRAAKKLQANHSSHFPKTENELLALPGIGKYTARAVLIFAYNKPIATVDVNIQRLLSRLYRKMETRDAMLPAEAIFELGEAILPAKRSRLWHEALMDFGATICTKRDPKCHECPLFDKCRSGRTLSDLIDIPKKQFRTGEPKYFGHPKRIWRGKILKIIAENDGLSAATITKAIPRSFSGSGFDAFLQVILDDLVSEGFCQILNKKYRLHP